MCDLSRAFDCVSHDLLLRKLSRYGIRGPPLDLLRSYLSNRQQCVDFSGSLSGYSGVTGGVPQGSVLGPLLFIIYVNDLYRFVSPQVCVQYADDTTFVCRDKDVNILKEECKHLIQRAEAWFANNNLKLNISKTQQLIVSSNPQMTCGDSVNLLGITVDDRLDWRAHLTNLRKKLSKSIFVINNLNFFWIGQL